MSKPELVERLGRAAERLEFIDYDAASACRDAARRFLAILEEETDE